MPIRSLPKIDCITKIHFRKNRISCPKALKLWTTAFVLCMALISCNSSVFDTTILVEKGQWISADTVAFEFEIKDTAKLYDIFVEIDHNANFAYQNIYCLVESYAPAGLAQRQVNALELATKKGKWLGECDSEICIRKIPFIINTQFDVPGPYKIVFTQYTRKETLEGINSLRLIVQEAT